MTEVAKEHSALPFSLRNLVPALGESGARMGVVEPVKHGILRPFPVLYEREGTALAHFQFTVLMLAGGSLRITGLDLPDYIKSEKSRESVSCAGDSKERVCLEEHASEVTYFLHTTLESNSRRKLQFLMIWLRYLLRNPTRAKKLRRRLLLLLRIVVLRVLLVHPALTLRWLFRSVTFTIFVRWTFAANAAVQIIGCSYL